MALTARARLLLVEDDPATAAYLREGLAEHDIDVFAVANGPDGLRRALSERWDIVILDRMLPGLGGLEILTQMRERDIMTPVLFLTTMDGVSSRVRGLRHGADDYMIKPFALRELVARVQVLLRRFTPSQHVTMLCVADVALDLLSREVTRRGEKIHLQPQELKLLEYFMRNPGTIISRRMLLKDVWNMDFPVRTNIVETHLSRLREKLGRHDRPLIHTIKGAGYVMKESDLEP
ncbi:response regulator transcription factor [Gluconacetobacter tumulicola]|uniref:Response regulator transcription factor n=1 Tax=Gluconacetobacter tumulicola TaxID=1017177 RepID=A0A7W4JFS4_9PROT|nr:response regulator transcription factor [Gluconacetobacter tumulicola]MBB2180242.1 response regulator transcription factor [Gluconacetobacter tumulicola]